MNRSNVPALGKAIRILHEIASNPSETTSSGLARKINASQPTTYRILKTLEAADWIRMNESNGYSLSLGLLPLLQHLDDFSRYGRAAQTIIDDLSRELDYTIKLSIMQGLEQIIVSIAEPRKPFGVSVPLGGRFPVVWGSPGACLLAKLSGKELETIIKAIPVERWKHETPKSVRRRVQEVRKSDFSESLGEHPLGLDTISTSVNTPSTPSALTMVGFSGEMTPKNLPRFRKRLLSAAKEIEHTLINS